MRLLIYDRSLFMNKKWIALLIALVLIPATLFAVPVVVTWEWMLEDPMVTTFRYQIDGEAADQWTVVDSSVTSYTVRGLDGSKSHTLYLQQSYDGEYFSASALSVSEPILAPEPEMVAVATEVLPSVEEPVLPVAEASALVVEEEVLPIAEEIVPVAEEEVLPVAEEIVPVAEEEVLPVAEEIVPVVEEEVVPVAEEIVPVVLPVAEATAATPVDKKESRSSTTITLGGGLNYQAQFDGVPGYNPYNIQASLGVQLNNLMTFNSNLGLGVDLGVSYTPYLSALVAEGWLGVIKDTSNFSSVDHAATISIAPVINMEFGKVVANVGVGGFFSYGPEFNSAESEKYMYGAFAKLGLGYQVNSWFSLGVEGKFGYVLSDPDYPMFYEGGVYLGFSF